MTIYMNFLHFVIPSKFFNYKTMKMNTQYNEVINLVDTRVSSSIIIIIILGTLIWRSSHVLLFAWKKNKGM